MEDSLSVKSNESIATSDEFDFVCDKPGSSKTPTLNVANGDLDELKKKLTEVLQEQEPTTPPTSTAHKEMETKTMKQCNVNVVNANVNVNDNDNESTHTVVGQSKFYDCENVVEQGEDALSANTSPSIEKQDIMKPELSSESDEEVSDIDQECTKFSGVTYLGAAAINAPKSEAEIQRNMAFLNEQSSEQGIKVAVSIPSSSQGVVVLYDATSQTVMARYEIHRILFYAHGLAGTPEASCFAFTWSHGDTLESAIFQCHVFRCDIPEAVTRVSGCFAKAFQRVPRSMSSSVASAAEMSCSITTLPDSQKTTLMYVFEVNLEIKEDDGRGTFGAVAKDKSGFKLRVNVEKQLCLTVRQVSDNGPQLHIERCFGVLVAPGRHVKHSDMRLLEMVLMGPTATASGTAEQPSCQICAQWDPTESAFEPLNVETPKDSKIYITVAVDLVIRGIQEPVRFLLETPVKVFSQNERFWFIGSRRSLVQQFFLNLKEVVTGELGDVHYEVLGMDTSGELDRNRLNLTLNLTSLIRSPSITSIDTLTPKEETLSDGDEPLLSGTGCVSKDCAVDVLENWAEVLGRWKSTRQRPRQLASLVRHGIPEALRGEVWQRLANTEENTHMMDIYRVLITKESSCENVIQRDIARTFPAHDFFKEAGGLGQDSLYRVSKAYAVYDAEVGYCQGLSFLAATLLLHMPEEQAFCILVKLMYDYNLRDLYKDGFENLYMRLYQLNRLMEEQLAPLWQHFAAHHVETHMFASQWFLTLFTARFPLYFVFHIIDVFLLQGIDTLFQVAMALLTLCKKDLLLLDFEGILKYFRVALPKKCRTEEASKQLMKVACSIKVKKLKKYEQEFTALKESWDIVVVNTDAQDNADTYTDEVETLRAAVTRHDEERKLMRDEITQLKEMLKREVNKADSESRRNQKIIADYKNICARLDEQLNGAKQALNDLRQKVSNCDKCRISSNIQLSAGTNSKNEKTEPLDGESRETERIRELELELAQTKLAHVEAECRNQDLTHQLNATVSELNTTKNSWPPWLSKTLSSIKEVANKKDLPSFYSIQSNQSSNNSHASATPTFISHINTVRRDSAPYKNDNFNHFDVRRESAPVLKDSQSYNSLRTHN